MDKKTSKYLVLSAALLVFSILLASCQSKIATTEEMDRKQAVDAWGANLTAQSESYREEEEQLSIPLIELRSDVPSQTEMVVDAYSPEIKIQRTWLEEKTFLTVYTVTSDEPAWIVFHANEDGLPGAILEYVWVGSGTNKIARTEFLEEISSEQIHVMLHHDFARIGMFEFPGPDGPVFVDNEIVNELCFCPF